MFRDTDQDEAFRRELARRRDELQFGPRSLDAANPLFRASADARDASSSTSAPGRRLRILFVLTAHHVDRQIRLFAELASIASAARHDVRFAAAYGWSDRNSGTAPPSAVKTAAGTFKVEPVPPADVKLVGPLAVWIGLPYRFYEWLKADAPDVVHAFDYFGSTYYAQMAKSAGVAFRDTHFCIHGSGGHCAEYLREFVSKNDPKLLALFLLERMVVEMADTLSVPTLGVAEQIARLGYRVDNNRLAVTPIWSSPAKTSDARPAPAQRMVQQIAFVCPTPSTRNISLAATMVKRLEAQGHTLPPVTIFFPPESADTRPFVDHQFRTVRTAWSIAPLSDWAELPARLEAIEGVLTVIPFIGHPYPFYELTDHLARRIPVLIGGDDPSADLIAPESRSGSVADSAVPDRMGHRLLDRLTHVAESASLAADPEGESGRWRRFFGALTAKPPANIQPPPGSPLVTVAILHFERPALVEQALASINAQTYPNLEVVLVDDGSTSAESRAKLAALASDFAARGWRIVVQENRYVGAARNTAAHHARGEYIFFLDDDNVLKSNAIELLVTAAETSGADIVASFADILLGEAYPKDGAAGALRIALLGGDNGYSLFDNGIADANALCRKESYLRLGGYTEHYAIGRDDQEFFLRASLSGARIVMVPEALYFARQLETRLRHRHFNLNAGYFRILDAAWRHVHPQLRPLLYIQQGYFGMENERSVRAGDARDADTHFYVSQVLRSAARRMDVQYFWQIVRASSGNRIEPSTGAHSRLSSAILATKRSATLPISPPADFDEAAYLLANPDAMWAVERGDVSSGFAHYVHYGRHEGRDRPAR